MKKFLAAAVFAVALSLTGFVSATPASAASPTVTVATDAASQSTDISARRYYRRYGYRPYYAPRYYAPRYYAPRPYYGGYGYGYRRPGLYFGF
jgi:hypothetical protein